MKSNQCYQEESSLKAFSDEGCDQRCSESQIDSKIEVPVVFLNKNIKFPFLYPPICSKEDTGKEFCLDKADSNTQMSLIASQIQVEVIQNDEKNSSLSHLNDLGKLSPDLLDGTRSITSENKNEDWITFQITITHDENATQEDTLSKKSEEKETIASLEKYPHYISERLEKESNEIRRITTCINNQCGKEFSSLPIFIKHARMHLPKK
ncbi:unnamed protein product [Moneuplotes crassus]|uniref:C2H2-type domain-containing protein n=1 Tax=Euplotes crassus TaxID=5936 RepID=A0AAD1XVY9_EUPCR|nr:unnamed protein product [Moneuplotes crassus]